MMRISICRVMMHKDNLQSVQWNISVLVHCMMMFFVSVSATEATDDVPSANSKAGFHEPSSFDFVDAVKRIKDDKIEDKNRRILLKVVVEYQISTFDSQKKKSRNPR